MAFNKDDIFSIAEMQSPVLQRYNFPVDLLPEIPDSLIPIFTISPHAGVPIPLGCKVFKSVPLAGTSVHDWLFSDQCKIRLGIRGLDSVTNKNKNRVVALTLNSQASFLCLGRLSHMTTTNNRKRSFSECNDHSVPDTYLEKFAKHTICFENLVQTFQNLEVLRLHLDVMILNILPPNLREFHFVSSNCIVSLETPMKKLQTVVLECLDLDEKSIKNMFITDHEREIKTFELTVRKPEFFCLDMISTVHFQTLKLNMISMKDPHMAFMDSKTNNLKKITLDCDKICYVVQGQLDPFFQKNEPDTLNKMSSLLPLVEISNAIELDVVCEDNAKTFEDGICTLKALRPTLGLLKRLSLSNNQSMMDDFSELNRGFEQYELNWFDWRDYCANLTHLHLRDIMFMSVNGLDNLTHLTVTVPRSVKVAGSGSKWKFYIARLHMLPCLRVLNLFVRDTDDMFPDQQCVFERIFDTSSEPRPKEDFVPSSVTKISVENQGASVVIPWFHCLDIETLCVPVQGTMPNQELRCKTLILDQCHGQEIFPFKCPRLENLHVKFGCSVAITSETLDALVIGARGCLVSLTVLEGARSITGPLNFPKLARLQVPFFCQVSNMSSEIIITRF